MPSEIDLLKQQLDDRDIEYAERTVTVSTRQRSPANTAKTDVMVAMLGIIDEDHVDQFFLEVLNLAAKLEYRLRDKPENLLNAIDRQHGQTS